MSAPESGDQMPQSRLAAQIEDALDLLDRIITDTEGTPAQPALRVNGHARAIERILVGVRAHAAAVETALREMVELVAPFRWGWEVQPEAVLARQWLATLDAAQAALDALRGPEEK